MKLKKDIEQIKCKRPGKNFRVKYFPRNEWSFEADKRSLQFGIDIRIHFINANKNRKPYVLVYDDSLEWCFAIDIDLKLYGYKNFLQPEVLEILLDKIKINREKIIQLWSDKFIDEMEWCKNLNR